MPLQDTDYLSASARIRACENSLLGREKLYQMTEAADSQEIYALLAEAGVRTLFRGDEKEGRPDEEATLSSLLYSAFALIEESVPDPTFFRFLRYPYDCHNLKAAMKCHIRGTEPGDMLFSCGSLAPADAVRAAAETDFHRFPAHMAQAAQQATLAFAKSRDPRCIDQLLDIACFRDMQEAVAPDPFLSRLLQVKTDLSNIMTVLRLLRAGLPDPVAHLDGFFLPGGTLSFASLCDACAEGLSGLDDLLAVSPYSSAFAGVNLASEPLGVLDCRCDNFYMDRVRGAKMIPFGPAVPAAYLIAREFEVKNLRIILGGKQAGLSPDAIRARVRRGYA